MAYYGNDWGTWPTGPWTYTPTRTVPTYSGTGSHLQMQRPVNNVLRVTGPESAKAYQVPPNSDVILFDANDPVFYWKSTDDSGFGTLRVFDFTERKQVEVEPVLEAANVDFATRDDVEDLKKKLSDISKALEGLM